MSSDGAGVGCDDELVSTEAADDIDLAEVGGEDGGHLFKELGAYFVAEGVVDVFQVVHIHEDDGVGCIEALGEAEGLGGEDIEAAAVIEAGEIVAEGEVVDAAFERLDAAGHDVDEAEGEQRDGGGGEGGGVLVLEPGGLDDGGAKDLHEKGRPRAKGAARREVLPAMLSLVKMEKRPKWVRSLKTRMVRRERQRSVWGEMRVCVERPERARAPKR